MKQLFIKGALFILLFVVLDRSLILLRNYIPELQHDKRLQYVLDGKVNPDILIMGASRGARGILAYKMEKELNTSVYNLSYPGADIEFHEFVLRQLLTHAKKLPKLIILTMDDDNEIKFMPTKHGFRYDVLYPLVKYRSIREELVSKEGESPVISELFIVSQLHRSSFDLFKKKIGKTDTVLKCGSMPLYVKAKSFTEKMLPVRKYDVANEDTAQMKKLLSFIKMCREKNIGLVFAFPPNFRESDPRFRTRMAEVCGGSDHFMFYDSTRREYSLPEYFYDAGHLKANGAELFTDDLISYLRQRGYANP
jgi:hypothetical protein